ncbi:hypothetical protein E6C27_scaffold979G00400 [Cucumis melo var. makuwa]|uniref:Uncharacterized protein n=1 Tax=Cucumis melo var. makuwa TaxID=1194695 RepID=A0A5A7VBF1_CUCMM|nr:hypothetical protein E6C27_scaffold1480G00210 [Cucumis melo var. makuwa]KAA0064938.1 hypothetical protein E6C27_scaffold82G002560 [Cucumis melo var. makuwa]KAA0066623.1 hypothetical protein E6C27_scaffold979G00400 [Cucumis melo var. makuwa]
MRGRRRNSWPTLNRRRKTHGQQKTDGRRKSVQPQAEEKSNVSDGKSGQTTNWGGRISGRKINWAQENRTWRKNIGAEESDAGRRRRRLVWEGDDMLRKKRLQMEEIEKLGISNF